MKRRPSPVPGPIGFLGGTGTAGLLPESRAAQVDTPFGPVEAWFGTAGGRETIFVSRHGPRHSTLPHEVNYRGNLWAFHQLGVRQVFATSACGSMLRDLGPGGMGVLVDFLDLTRSRPGTYRGTPGLPESVDFYHSDLQPPYCPAMHQALQSAAADSGPEPLREVVYAGVEGPRFESPAEIQMLARLGADVVGMTGLPEAALARELGLCYAVVALVTNMAAGLSATPLEHGDVERSSRGMSEEALRLIAAAAAALPPPAACCPAATRRDRWFPPLPVPGEK